MIPHSIALLLHYKTEQLFLFQEAAQDWQSLKPEERELLKQTEQSFKAYLRAHSIDYTASPENPTTETVTEEELHHLSEKTKYLIWVDQLKKTLVNQEGVRNYNRFVCVLDQLNEARERIETLLLAEESDKQHWHNKRAAVMMPSYKERYEKVFLPISQRAFERREKEAKLPIFYARIEDEKKVSAFYIHFGNTDTELERYLTGELTRMARTESVNNIGDLVIIQSNRFVPPKIGNDPVLTSLGIQPELVKIDYPKK